MNRPALFLDRDGVINVDHGYVHKPEAAEFIDGIFELVAAAKRAGYLVVVVTNQAGIGRGYYSDADFHALMDWMKARFVKRGGQVDAVYFCPDHPESGIGGYHHESEFRKPAPPRCQGSCRLSEMESGIGWGRKVDYRDEALFSRT